MKRKLIYGIGVNDADYSISKLVDGKQVRCPYYVRWCSILVRCYSSEFQETHPSYIGCSVVSEWLTFSVFRKWMIEQDWQGKQLDKDILVQGNKVYSPVACIFVSCSVNLLLINNKAARGMHPQGVSFYNRTKKYRAVVSVDGRWKHLGYFSTSELASDAYKKAKYEIIRDVALEQVEPLRSALLNYRIGE